MRAPLIKLIAGAVAALLVTVLLVQLLFSASPTVELAPPVHALGVETPVRVTVNSPNGIRRFSVFVEQGASRFPVYDVRTGLRLIVFGRQNESPREFRFPVGRKQADGMKEGKAQLLVEAVSNDLRGSMARLSQPVTVNFQPPRVSSDNLQHYINQGGAELVTFTVSGSWSEAGVRAGSYRFRSFPLPGKSEAEGERFALFAFPWDLDPKTVPLVYARNATGAEVTAPFWHKVFPKPVRKRELPLDDGFLQKVTAEIEPQGQGSLIERFLRINGALRRANNQTLSDLRHKTQQRWLWDGPFLQLGNSKVESQFADRRTYVYQGKKVDQQMHLGFDLSVTKNVAIAASNSGTVISAQPLGIYGNCVVLDHGFGLQSIYAHLSQIDVRVGQSVKRGETLGKSGATGLAGGDHLHYSMQVDGVQVNPVEWWDAHWIQDRIASKVPPASGAKALAAVR